MKGSRHIPFMKELMLLLREGWLIMIGSTRNLVISLVFPIIASVITVWIAGQDMFLNCESTKSACFIVVCAAIWGGLFNSIQVVVKERKNIRRDYMCGALRISAYLASRALLQLLLCMVQSLMLSLSFIGVQTIYGNEMPGAGILFTASYPEFLISIFLIMLAADALGLFVSCIVKSEQLASQLSPYILILQLLFSGVLFTMEGAASSLSALMLSRWGMEALGSISNVNDLPLRLQTQFPMIPHNAENAFTYSSEHLIQVWVILLAFTVVPLILGGLLLTSIRKDSRE